ncbi:hypothetical protein FQA39_LY12839 [Lamprigera yunnana]|nr:hypothetical protein FQA39_LY12839 [Lamprigera yunnana]
MQNGQNHLYYGFGKGKTSILNGTIVRAVGQNMKIGSTKFIWDMETQEIEVFKAEMRVGYQELKKALKTDKYDIIVADELTDCIVNKFITNDELLELLKVKNPKVEFIVSGHNVDEVVRSKFDLVTLLTPEKHYFDKGIQARKGIEY